MAAQQEGPAAAQQRKADADADATLLDRLKRLAEEIQEMRQQFREGLAQPAPAAPAIALEPEYHLSELIIVGEVDGKTARLKADLKATVHRDGGFAIPLNPFAALRVVEPTGAVIPASEGYRWRVEGKGEHALHLEFTVPLQEPQVGSRQLRMPVVSPLESPVARLLLTVPGERIEARNGEGQQLPVAWDGERSQIEWNGLPHEGLMSVEWQRRPARERARARLQSDARWQVDVQKNVAVIQSTLVLQSRGGVFDQFQVLLPPGAKHVTCDVAGKKSENLGPPDQPEGGSLLSVMLETPTTVPLSVRLEFEQPIKPIDPEQGELVLRGLVIQDADSQAGYLLVHEADDLEVVPSESDSVQRISLRDLPQGLREGRGGLAFRYLRQPFELSTVVRARKPLVAAEPSMSLLLVRDGNAVKGLLHARWVVSVRHAPVPEIDFDLGGWEAGPGAVRVMRVESEGPPGEPLIDSERTQVDEAGRMHVQLSRPVQEPFVVEMEAERALRAGRGIAVSLPRALVGPVSDSRVAVFAGGGVRMRPRFEAMPAAVPDYYPNLEDVLAPPQGIGLQGQPQVLRLREGREALSLDLEVLPPIVQAGCRSRITLGEKTARVEQQFTLLAQNGALSELLLDVPLSLANTRVYAAAGSQGEGERPFEQLLSSGLRRVVVDSDPTTNERVWRVTVRLSEPQRGRFEWMLRYEVPLEMDGTGATPVAIPLVMPKADVLTFNEVEVLREAALEVIQKEADPWRVVDVGAAEGALRLRADGRVFAIHLLASRRNQFTTEPVVIARAWLRTSIDPTGVRYQGLYRVRTDLNFVKVKLPSGALRPRVRVNGTAAHYEMQDDGSYRVFLPRDEQSNGGAERTPGTHLLDIEYAISSSEHLSGLTKSYQLAAPWFADARWEERWYWQVLVPKQQHLFVQSGRYYPELRWVWGGLTWGRQASRSTGELNRWIHADVPVSDSAASYNEYLFSRLGKEAAVGGTGVPENPTLELRTVTPPLLILMGSGAFVVFGLLLVSWSAARSLPVVFVVAFVAMVAASLYPSPALLLLQAAVPGLALVGVAGLLHWNLWRRQQRGVLVSAERSSILTIPSTLAPQAESAGSVGSTRTGSRSSVGGVP